MRKLIRKSVNHYLEANEANMKKTAFIAFAVMLSLSLSPLVLCAQM
jgi:hypothetical protein